MYVCLFFFWQKEDCYLEGRAEYEGMSGDTGKQSGNSLAGGSGSSGIRPDTQGGGPDDGKDLYQKYCV